MLFQIIQNKVINSRKATLRNNLMNLKVCQMPKTCHSVHLHVFAWTTCQILFHCVATKAERGSPFSSDNSTFSILPELYTLVLRLYQRNNATEINQMCFYAAL